MDWRVRQVFWKRLFVSIFGILALLGIAYLWQEPSLYWRHKRLFICLDCGFVWDCDSVTILSHRTRRAEVRFKPSPLSRALEVSEPAVCGHRDIEIVEEDFLEFRSTWPFVRRFHECVFPLNQMAAVLLQTAKTNKSLAQRTLRYALSIDPSDLTRSNLLARQDLVGLVNLVQSTNVSYRPEDKGIVIHSISTLR
jgi:hypothetical protein